MSRAFYARIDASGLIFWNWNFKDVRGENLSRGMIGHSTKIKACYVLIMSFVTYIVTSSNEYNRILK
jgi:hypothetical protein